MSAISEYAGKMDVHHDAQDVELAAISTAQEGLAGDVAFIKSELERINNSPGQITAEDQASLDRLLARAGAMTTKLTDTKNRLTALDDMTPPAPPPA